jgi:hypothetical protein
LAAVTSGREVVYRYEGRDLRIADVGGCWRVAVDDRASESPFLDKALAELLQLDTATAVALARRILETREGGSVEA